MAESHVVSALVNKRAEIAGMIARTQQQLGQFRADLAHVDATTRLVAPAMKPETIPAKRIRQSDPLFERGGLSRRVLDALRRAGIVTLTEPTRFLPTGYCVGEFRQPSAHTSLASIRRTLGPALSTGCGFSD